MSSVDGMITGPTGDDYTRVTINDVAREAGVSVATVSKVVNQRYGVAKATSEKVMAVVERLGYETSLVAASLRRTSTNVIGILLAGFESYSVELLKGISAEALGKGYELLAFSGAISDDSRVGWEKRSISRIGGTLIDGAILITPTVSLPQTNMPMVSIDPHTDPEGSQASIDADNMAGAREAVEHLVDLGHKRIAHIRGRIDLESAHQRERAYREALSAAGIPYQESLVKDGGYRRNWARSAAVEFLEMPEDQRPTAIFAANDHSALGVMDAAEELGIAVPEQLSIVGFDDIPEAASANPRLTTVAQPLAEMGAKAFNTVVAMIRGEAVEARVHMPARLIIRQTTGIPQGA